MFRPLLTWLLGGLVATGAIGCSGGGGTLPSGLPKSISSVSTDARDVRSRANITSKVQASTPGVAFSDDFSQDVVPLPAVGWNVVSGTWSACQAGAVHAYCQTSVNTGESINGASWWSDYSVEALVTDTNTAYGGAGIIGRATSSKQFYLFELRPQENGTAPYWYVLKKSATTSTILASGALQAPDKNPNFRLRLAFAGSHITASIAFDGGSNYQTLATLSDSSYPTGQIGLLTWGTASRSFGQVVVTLANAVLPVESAISSGTFVDSIGMNATYGSNYAQVRPLIAKLGIRHYRVSAGNILSNKAYTANLTDLYSAFGIKFNVLSDLHTSPLQIVNALGRLPAGSVDSVEGPNESDNPWQGAGYDPNFGVDVPAYMAALYPMIKSTPATSQVAIIGPSFMNVTSYAAIGNISGFVDNGNTHDYFAGFNPGTLGWGGGGYVFAPRLNYGSIDWNIAASGQATQPKPVVATETGYYTASVHGGLPLDVQSKYVPRLYFEQFRHNIVRTFMFELVGYNSATADGSRGIVSPSYSPNAAYNALAGMIGLLADSGIKGSPINYSLGFTGQVANVDHLLLHKADGTFVLPLWIEAPSFDPNANGGLGAEIAVPQQAVTVNLPPTAGNGVLWTCNATTGAWSSNPVILANGAVTINVSDSVSILEIGHM